MEHRVDVHEAKTHLSRLLDEIERGRDVVIERAGRPVARLVRYEAASSPRVPGAWRGRVRIAEDFDELPPDVTAAFRGE